MRNFIYGPSFHSDFFITWDSAFEGSIATTRILERGFGTIKMKYSEWPYLLVALAYSINDFSLFDEDSKATMKSFAAEDYKWLLSRVKSDADRMERLRIECRELPLPICKKLKVVEVEEVLKDAGVELERTRYAGMVPPSVEYDEPVHVLSSDAKETYIGQWWNGMNMLRLNEEQAKEMIKSVPGFY